MRTLGMIVIVIGSLVAGCAGPSSTPTPLQMLSPVECVGIPAQTCQEIVADARRNAQPGTFPVLIRAVCSQVPCTAAQGMVDISIQYSDGHTERSGMGWAGTVGDDAPIPEMPPVDPVCQGVPLEQCTEMALGAIGGDPGAVISVLVRCTAAPCTADRGAGDTILTFVDGLTSTSSWSYEGATPSG